MAHIGIAGAGVLGRLLALWREVAEALPDNHPHTHAEPGLLRINGLFRHGWLLAPALVDDALARCGPHTEEPLAHA